MDNKTKEMVREWVEKDGGDIERTAKWMAYALRIGFGIKKCRELIAEAMQ